MARVLVLLGRVGWNPLSSRRSSHSSPYPLQSWLMASMSIVAGLRQRESPAASHFPSSHLSALGQWHILPKQQPFRTSSTTLAPLPPRLCGDRFAVVSSHRCGQGLYPWLLHGAGIADAHGGLVCARLGISYTPKSQGSFARKRSAQLAPPGSHGAASAPCCPWMKPGCSEVDEYIPVCFLPSLLLPLSAASLALVFLLRLLYWSTSYVRAG